MIKWHSYNSRKYDTEKPREYTPFESTFYESSGFLLARIPDGFLLARIPDVGIVMESSIKLIRQYQEFEWCYMADIVRELDNNAKFGFNPSKLDKKKNEVKAKCEEEEENTSKESLNEHARIKINSITRNQCAGNDKFKVYVFHARRVERKMDFVCSDEDVMSVIMRKGMIDGEVLDVVAVPPKYGDKNGLYTVTGANCR